MINAASIMHNGEPHRHSRASGNPVPMRAPLGKAACRLHSSQQAQRHLVCRRHQRSVQTPMGTQAKSGCRLHPKVPRARAVYYELHADMLAAITREKQIKKWNRAWKIQLIERMNPDWRDLWHDIR